MKAKFHTSAAVFNAIGLEGENTVRTPILQMRMTTSFLLSALLLVVCPRADAEVTGTTGGGQPLGNVQPSLALNYIVRTDPSSTELGRVSLFAGAFRVPAGWSLAEGQVLNIADNPALYGVLGNTYGGDGVNTFALPDLRGRTAIGQGQGPGLTNQLLGEATGVEEVALTKDQLPAHAHGLPAGGMTDGTGGGQPFQNMQPSLALNYTLTTNGFFPSAEGGSGSGTFIGEIRMNAGPNDPPYRVSATGQLLLVAHNTILYPILGGNRYGGDGVSTIAAPDLRGRAPIGVGQGPGLTDRTLAELSGIEQVILSEDQLPAHTHSLPAGGMTDPAGGDQPFDNMQPVLGLHYMFATLGLFPSSDGPGTDDTMLSQITLFAGDYAAWRLDVRRRADSVDRPVPAPVQSAGHDLRRQRHDDFRPARLARPRRRRRRARTGVERLASGPEQWRRAIDIDRRPTAGSQPCLRSRAGHGHAPADRLGGVGDAAKVGPMALAFPGAISTPAGMAH